MTESFQDCVAHLMIMIEETRRNLSLTSPIEHAVQLDNMIIGRLEFLHRQHQDDVQDLVKRDIYWNCHSKVQQLARLILERAVEPTEKIVYDEDIPGQAAVARLAELNLLLLSSTSYRSMDANPVEEEKKNSTLEQDNISKIIELYSNYQRQVLRQRAKPAIAHLANWRNSDLKQRQARNNHLSDHDNDVDEITQPHSHALTFVLGYASALIHPLQQWNETLPTESPISKLCITSIRILDQQTCILAKSICDWFLQDKAIDSWMQQQHHHQNERSFQTKVDLSELDTLVEEMAYSCQVMARYTALMENSSFSDITTSATSSFVLIQQQLLPELTWKYAALERFLVVQQLESAVDMACPVDIVLGSNIQVPSVVEDAQYLSSRALERATSTRNPQAMGTVAHSLSHDVWSTDETGGVFLALLSRKGCDPSLAESSTKNSSSLPSTASAPKSGDFASALLDALDDDLKTSSRGPKAFTPAPHSGGFLGAFVMGAEDHVNRLHTQLCAMNGIFAASTACKSLIKSLNVWLDEQTQSDRMVELARDELIRFSNSYKIMLDHEVQSTVSEWCGSLERGGAPLKGKCLHVLRDCIEHEVYILDSATFANSESDDRLEDILIRPVNESLLIRYLDHCDVEVGFAICREFSKQLATLIVEALWNKPMQFNEWGSLLLSKQVRMLQTLIINLLPEDTAHPERSNSLVPTSEEWERLLQVTAVLQLERPSDWSIYQSTSVLTTEELRQTLRLRVDFSVDAIHATCQAQKSK